MALASLYFINDEQPATHSEKVLKWNLMLKN